MPRTIFFISDGTGITAETLGHSLMTQFQDNDHQEVTLPFVDNVDSARVAAALIDKARIDTGVRPIVYATLTDPSVLDLISASDALVVDVFGAFIAPLQNELQQRPALAKHRLHGLLDRNAYDVRIEAINFALDHDDGASTKKYRQADVIIAGVSRTGKTPTCLYLAMQYGVHAANFPLTEEDLDLKRVPRLLQPVRQRVYGLTIDPERLHRIRTERRPDSEYAALSCCEREVRQAEHLFAREKIPCLNSTAISIEEIATRIIQEMGLKRRLV
jgi:[pyruvate, water dikinase]-phosphate phosphotransferase / [pyruvate, water dikinase] kinase